MQTQTTDMGGNPGGLAVLSMSPVSGRSEAPSAGALSLGRRQDHGGPRQCRDQRIAAGKSSCADEDAVALRGLGGAGDRFVTAQ